MQELAFEFFEAARPGCCVFDQASELSFGAPYTFYGAHVETEAAQAMRFETRVLGFTVALQALEHVTGAARAEAFGVFAEAGAGVLHDVALAQECSAQRCLLRHAPPFTFDQ